MLRRSWLRAATPLTVLIVAASLVGTASPAQAATTGPDSATTGSDSVATGPDSAATPAARSIPITVRQATTEQIRAMAAAGNGSLITVGGQAAKGQNTRDGDGVVMSPMVICVLSVGAPYGGGAYDRPVYVTAYTYCNDYVDLAVVTVQLFHGDDLVGSYYSSFVYVTQFSVTAASAGCQDGVYYGFAFGTIYRGNASSTSHVGAPRNMGCAPPPPPAPAFAVTNPGTRTTLEFSGATLQMTATGGTPPYTWSATGLPTGLSINSSTGLISGPTGAPATFNVTVTAVDAAGRTASTQFTWIIRREACRTC